MTNAQSDNDHSQRKGMRSDSWAPQWNLSGGGGNIVAKETIEQSIGEWKTLLNLQEQIS